MSPARARSLSFGFGEEQSCAYWDKALSFDCASEEDEDMGKDGRGGATGIAGGVGWRLDWDCRSPKKNISIHILYLKVSSEVVGRRL